MILFTFDSLIAPPTMADLQQRLRLLCNRYIGDPGELPILSSNIRHQLREWQSNYHPGRRYQVNH